MGDEFCLAYVAGVLCSSGSIIWSPRAGNYALRLETSDSSLADLFLDRLNRCSNKAAKIYTRARGGGKKSFIVSLYGRVDVSKLVGRLGLKINSQKWEVPEATTKSMWFRRGFLQGLCDGGGGIYVRLKNRDGVIQKRRIIRITSINSGGLKQVRGLLEMEGIKSMFYRAGESHFVIDIEGKLRCQAFQKTIGFGSPEKQKRLEEVLVPLTAYKH